MGEVLARGPNFVYGEEFARGQYGDQLWERALQSLEPAHRAVWQGTLLVSGVYPFAAFKAMVQALAAETGTVARDETARMYEFIAERSLSTVHRIFLRIASPAFVLRNYPMLWKRYFNTGTVRVPEASTGRAKLVFELPEIFLDWLPPACLGYSRKAVEMAGGRDVELAERDAVELAEGNWRIEYGLGWVEGGPRRRRRSGRGRWIGSWRTSFARDSTPEHPTATRTPARYSRMAWIRPSRLAMYTIPASTTGAANTPPVM